MSGQFIGIDTSCYTTSAACAQNQSIVADKRAVLCVACGERGLRQSDGVFQHTRNLPNIINEVMDAASHDSIKAVAVSVRPRPDKTSYMPVFLAGKATASALAIGLGVPLYELSHQQGHVRAALLGNEVLIDEPFLGMHISGGTTEIFTVKNNLSISVLGGSKDLHAGQFVDRLGVAMGMPFPCGKHMEKAAAEFNGNLSIKLPLWVRDCDCSFSGTEAAAMRIWENGADKAELAFAIYDVLCRTFHKMAVNAADKTGLGKILIAGGVASSPLLREMLAQRMAKRGHVQLFFGKNELSSDNAAGIALMCEDIFEGRLTYE